MTERYCKDCKWFCDAAYDRVYITPRCNVRGSDDASFMRRFICTLEGKLYEARPDLPQPPLPLPA